MNIEFNSSLKLFTIYPQLLYTAVTAFFAVISTLTVSVI